ncbi:FCD domain-containing protein [Desertimonas flava]|uniref:FCD domain-containing protein n=1 Tax=Desertimonas flava TaxID=2064846 RepID=UPI001D0C2E4B|nr:FCD domain-containing protein [Desertimonas flava]
MLESAETSLVDVATALQDIEPLCVRYCALRPDRRETVVPALRKVHEAAVELSDSDERFTEAARRFHEVLAAECGNQTLKVLVGALIALWSGHESEWACHGEVGRPTAAQRRVGTAAHARLIELIDAGDADAAMALAREHVAASQNAALSRTSQQTVRSAAVSPLALDRARELRGGGR